MPELDYEDCDYCLRLSHYTLHIIESSAANRLIGTITEKALVGAFSVIVQLVVEPMDSFTALVMCNV